jgi:unsaturated rhamnogalacturonyl hydrolase
MLHAFLRWLARIHIGRWDDTAAWAAAVERAARRQWKHPPSIPITDSRAPLAILRARHGAGARLRFWHRASLALALPAEGAAQTLQPPKGFAFCVEWGVACYAALRGGLTAQTPWIAAAANECLALAAQNGGTIPYAKGLEPLRLVDTLWMLCPFLTLCGCLTGDSRCTALARRQLDQYLQQGLHPATGLPAHSFALADGSPAGVYGWGRGSAFLLLALLESAKASASGGDAAFAAWLWAQAVPVADAILRNQLPGGGWGWLPHSETRAESSATAMLGYGYALLAANKSIETARRQAYASAAQAAVRCLRQATRRDGTVDYAQGDTRGVGYYSALREPLPLTQAYALRLFQLWSVDSKHP